MFAKVLYDPQALALQVKRQQKYAWDLETQIPWRIGVDTDRYFLPIDSDAIAFPGASEEQKLAISQLLGLIVNSTIAELEDVITKVRYDCWSKIIRNYPIGPEIKDLGELFFEEEIKHSKAFNRYNLIFCEETKIDIADLNRLLPKAYGSLFVKAIKHNAKWGGHAFWWVVAAVEEVSIDLYKNLSPFKNQIDPLYHQVHLKHMEEESRHHNYAFLMLELIRETNSSLSDHFFSKTDRIIGQMFSTGWVVAELNKVFEAKHLKHKHPFFNVIASCEPLFKGLGPKDLAKKLFISAPYISLMLNGNYHSKSTRLAKEHTVLSVPFPKPHEAETFIPLKKSQG